MLFESLFREEQGQFSLFFFFFWGEGIAMNAKLFFFPKVLIA